MPLHPANLPSARSGCEIVDPTMLMALYSRRLLEGKINLHPWQTRFHRQFAVSWDYNRVKRNALVANNGSGKSSLILAPCNVWLAMYYKQARCVITSASGVQLDRQTSRSIVQICEDINRFHDAKLWEIKYREYTYTPSNSKIELYATDEAGKAEGYHPFDYSESQIFSVGCDEAKSISDSLFEPISRCNGMTHWTLVSSPGQPQGFFYNAVCSDRWNVTKVTAYDCPHIREDEIEGAKEAYGEFSPFFRSAYLAEFTSIDEQVVIPYETILRQIKSPAPFWDDNICRAGLDLSGGGDENVLSVWRGNKEVGLESFRFSDTTATRLHLLNLFRKYNQAYGLKAENINADDGHVGKAIIDQLHEHGWPVARVRFGGSPFNGVAYANRGTELWMNFARHLPYLILLNDKTQTNQLSSRYYTQNKRTQKIQLEAKAEAKAKGHHSPDRADAVVLAFAKVPITYFAKVGSVSKEILPIDEIGSMDTGLNIPRLQEGNLTEEQQDRALEIYRSLREKELRELAERERQSGIGNIIYRGEQKNLTGGFVTYASR